MMIYLSIMNNPKGECKILEAFPDYKLLLKFEYGCPAQSYYGVGEGRIASPAAHNDDGLVAGKQ